jgi:lipopolysaccharide biosynthesis regulator YciM
LRRKDHEEAIRLARKAADEHADSVRASLTLGKAEEAAGDPRAAIRALELVAEQDRRFLPEAIDPLLRCAQAVGELDRFVDFMREVEPEHPPSAAVLAQARMMRDTGMNPARYLAEAFSANPSWALLEQLIDAIELPPDETMAQAIVSLRDALRKAAASRVRYRCGSCGLSPGLLFWQCPSCKQWGSIAPADDRLAPA